MVITPIHVQDYSFFETDKTKWRTQETNQNSQKLFRILVISMGAVERDPPLSKNIRITWCPKNCRQGVECRTSCAYKSSTVFPAASIHKLFTVFGVLLIFISPMALTSLQSNHFEALATSAGRRTRSGFQLASDPCRGALAPSATHILIVCSINTSCRSPMK